MYKLRCHEYDWLQLNKFHASSYRVRRPQGAALSALRLSNQRSQKKEKIMAADIPAEVTSKMPVIIPIHPCTLSSVSAPCTKELPKLVIGTVAPAPANFTNGSYKPTPSRTAPVTTKAHIVWAGVIFPTSIMSWPITQITPPTRNAHKKNHPSSPPMPIYTRSRNGRTLRQLIALPYKSLAQCRAFSPLSHCRTIPCAVHGMFSPVTLPDNPMRSARYAFPC